MYGGNSYDGYTALNTVQLVKLDDSAAQNVDVIDVKGMNHKRENCVVKYDDIYNKIIVGDIHY